MVGLLPAIVKEAELVLSKQREIIGHPSPTTPTFTGFAHAIALCCLAAATNHSNQQLVALRQQTGSSGLPII